MKAGNSEGDAGGARNLERPATVAIVGDGTLDEQEAGSDDERKARLAEELGERLVEAGYRIVCGGLGGVMEAACRGAHRAADYREGMTVGVVPGERVSAANEWVDVVIPTGMGHLRNALVAQSEAVVAVGGGAGTLSEMAHAWIHDRMIVAMEVEGWSGEMAGRRIDPRERIPGFEADRVFGATSAEEAVDLLARHLERYRAV